MFSGAIERDQWHKMGYESEILSGQYITVYKDVVKTPTNS